MKTRVVISQAYGGFGLSEEAAKMFNELKGLKEGDKGWVNPDYGNVDWPRYDPDLVKVVETLGSKRASGGYADLAIIEFDGPKFRITEYDGYEGLETPDTVDWEIVNTPEAQQEYPEYFI